MLIPRVKAAEAVNNIAGCNGTAAGYRRRILREAQTRLLFTTVLELRCQEYVLVA